MKFFEQKIKIARPRTSKFDLSHEKKLTLNMGELIPIMCQEVIPGDSFKAQSEIIARFAPMLAPMYQRINLYTHYFFVPNRIVWDEWEKFITGGEPGDVAPVHPKMLVGSNSYPALNDLLKAGELADYMGLPSNETIPATGGPVQYVSSLPFRAYQTIYNEYYRDQNLITKLAIPKTSGVDGDGAAGSGLLLTKRKRAWEKDYGTSAQPTAQKGAPVGLPLEYKSVSNVFDSNGAAADPNTLIGTNGTDGSQMMVGKTDAVTGGELGRIENIDIGTINDLRKANALQRWLEKMQRGGSRYAEQLLHMWNVMSDDARLQRPEYLGGGIQPVSISEVLSTYDNTTGGLPQGNMSGHGISVGNTNGFTKRFKEHGYIIGIMSILPKTGYMQGIPRHLQRFDKFDYAWPDFANLGEQEIKNKEIFMDWADVAADNNTWPELTFGYQSRYAEYKFAPNTTHGDFRTNLLFWHLDRIFASRPALNQSFVEADPSTRIFAIEDPAIHHVWCNIYNRVSAIRPLPQHGTPTL